MEEEGGLLGLLIYFLSHIFQERLICVARFWAIRVTLEAPVASFLELGLATGATSVKRLHSLVDSLVLLHPLSLFCPGCSFLHRFWIQGGTSGTVRSGVGWAKAGSCTEVPAADLAIAACIDASISNNDWCTEYPSPVGTVYSWVCVCRLCFAVPLGSSLSGSSSASSDGCCATTSAGGGRSFRVRGGTGRLSLRVSTSILRTFLLDLRTVVVEKKA